MDDKTTNRWIKWKNDDKNLHSTCPIDKMSSSSANTIIFLLLLFITNIIIVAYFDRLSISSLLIYNIYFLRRSSSTGFRPFIVGLLVQLSIYTFIIIEVYASARARFYETTEYFYYVHMAILHYDQWKRFGFFSLLENRTVFYFFNVKCDTNNVNSIPTQSLKHTLHHMLI